MSGTTDSEQEKRKTMLRGRLNLYMDLAKEVLDDRDEFFNRNKDCLMMAALILCIEDNLTDINQAIHVCRS